MKKLINVCFVAMGLMLSATLASAQQKFGHLNSDELYATMPEAKSAQTVLENLQKERQTEIEKMINEYQNQYKSAQEKERTLSEANKEVVLKEIENARVSLENLGKRIEDAKTKATKDINDKQTELFPKVNQKLMTAINAVAKEKGLAYVFDISVSQGFNNLIYFDGGEDITEAVKTKLGIAATPATAPKK